MKDWRMRNEWRTYIPSVDWFLEYRVDDSTVIDLTRTFEKLPFSNLAAISVFRRMWERELLYSDKAKIWRHWDGRVWVPAGNESIPNLIQSFAENYTEALNIIKDAQIAANIIAGNSTADARERYEERWAKHRRYRDSLWKSGYSILARDLALAMGVDESYFDDDYSVVVADNVVLTEEGGIISAEKHDSRRLITKRLGEGVRYEPGAPATNWRKFLRTSIEDTPQREWLQVLLGAALFGHTYKGLVELVGVSDGGKTTLGKVILSIFGSYATVVDIEVFLKGGRPMAFEKHELRGSRLTFAEEPEEGRKFSDSMIKNLTGGMKQTTRTVYGKPVTWEPHVAVMIACNEPIGFNTADEAMTGRIAPVRFPHKHRRVKDFMQQFEDEKSGILNWLLDGAHRYLESGWPDIPESMAVLRNEMVDTLDLAYIFLSEKMEEGYLAVGDPSGTPLESCATKDYLWQMFQVWLLSSGHRLNAVPKRRFFSQVGKRFPVMGKYNNVFMGLVRTHKEAHGIMR